MTASGEPCEDCKGEGRTSHDFGRSLTTCGKCKGTGLKKWRRHACRNCKGAGYLDGVCTVCLGSGVK